MERFEKKQLKAISDLVYERFGISIREDKFSRLEPKLEKMIIKEHYSGLDELYERLVAGDELCSEKLVKYITTCHTFFFREPDHFQQLVLFIHSHPKTSYRIWCAACSTGEEPYSITMTLLDNGISNFHIIASDINKAVLAYFNKGIYHKNRLTYVSPAAVEKYFVREGEVYYKIDPKLRNYISIKDINLMDTVRFSEQFDCIFCRNVFIYFDESSRKQAVNTITSNLKIGGLFFIGHAEVLLCQPENLEKVGRSVYRRIY